MMCREAIIRFILLLLGGQPSIKIVMHHEMMVPILSFHGMISSFHGMIPSFYGMISSFHAVFSLRQRDKSAKVIDYNDQDIRP